MHNLFTSYFKDKETAEAEALDGRDEEDEDEAVPVENESYVNLRKKMVNKHNLKMDNLLQENGKLCREFQKKQVIHTMTEKQQRLVIGLFYNPSSEIYLFLMHCWPHPSCYPVIQACRVHAGAEEEAACLARKRKYPEPVRPVPGTGDQRDDWVSHTGKSVVIQKDSKGENVVQFE